MFLQKGFFFISWKKSHVSDRFRIVKCYSCCSYGHSDQKGQSDLVCPKCTRNHELTDCNSDVLQCINCVNYNKSYKKTPIHEDILVLGDFNVNFLTENKISQCLQCYNLDQLVKEPTIITEHSVTLLDPIFFTSIDKCQDVGTLSVETISSGRPVAGYPPVNTLQQSHQSQQQSQPLPQQQQQVQGLSQIISDGAADVQNYPNERPKVNVEAQNNDRRGDTKGSEKEDK
nr:unnamed protein product [Callosobruchus chinensis]